MKKIFQFWSKKPPQYGFDKSDNANLVLAAAISRKYAPHAPDAYQQSERNRAAADLILAAGQDNQDLCAAMLLQDRNPWQKRRHRRTNNAHCDREYHRQRKYHQLGNTADELQH